MINAIIFDLDGTLVHSLPGISTSINSVLKHNGIPTHPEAAVRTFIGDGMRIFIQRAAPADAPSKLLDTLYQQVNEHYAATWKQGTTPYPGISEALHQLTAMGVAMAVFSNKPDIFCREMTDYLFPKTKFAAVIGQREGVPSKPDPTGAFDTAKHLGVPASEITFLGDSTIDIATAQNAGMLPIAASWGYHNLPALEAENPAHIIHNIDQLIPLVSALS
jgi:phosphoglycolate phosphatase